MKKNKKIIIGVFILGIILVIGYFGARYFIIRSFFKSQQPKEPKIEVPITYNIGWWSHQNLLIVDNFSVEISDSRLNLFNSKSIIAYTVSGKLKVKKGWKPYIKEVHISERVDTSKSLGILIEITPIVGLEKVEDDIGEQSFEFTNEHQVSSRFWGDNSFRFFCGRFEKDIEVFQRK